MRLLWLLVALAVVSTEAGALSARASEVEEYIKSHQLAHSHVGVGFDVRRGLPTSARLFKDATFETDPFAGGSRVDVWEVGSLEELHEVYAAQLGLDFVPGMFVKAQLPYHAPEERGHGETEDATRFLSVRAEEIVGVRLGPDATSRLDAQLVGELEGLPNVFDASLMDHWAGFFSRFGTHWTDGARVGGKLVVSTATGGADDDAQGPPDFEAVKRELDSRLSGLPYDDAASQCALLGRRTHDQVTSVGGAPLETTDLCALTAAAYGRWVASLAGQPAVTRYSVRHIAELASTRARRQALLEAARAYLSAGHAAWRKEHEQQFHSMEQDVAAHLSQQHTSLLSRKRTLFASILLLQEQLKVASQCEQQAAVLQAAQSKCQMERKAFQKSYVLCEHDVENLESNDLKLKACQMDLLSCGVSLPRGAEAHSQPLSYNSKGGTEAPKRLKAPGVETDDPRLQPGGADEDESAAKPEQQHRRVWGVLFVGVVVIVLIVVLRRSV